MLVELVGTVEEALTALDARDIDLAKERLRRIAAVGRRETNGSGAATER